MNNPPLFSKQLRILNLLLVIAAALLIGYIFLGYGHVTIPESAGTGLYINNQFVGKNVQDVKLRPGSYTFRVTSTLNADTLTTVKVGIFSQQTIKLSQTPLDLTSAARAASGFTSGSLRFDNAKRFGAVWAAGIVNTPTDSAYLVMKYEAGKWDAVYLGDGSDSDFSIVVPGNILTYLLSLPANNVGRGNGN